MPPAKGEYRYVSKFSDDYSCMKEIYLLRNKYEAGESLHQYDMTVAVPLVLRIEIVRCDIRGEYIDILAQPSGRAARQTRESLPRRCTWGCVRRHS